MNAVKTTLVAATLALGSLTTAANADDKAVVQVFYDLLSNPGSEEHTAAFSAATAEDWISIGNYSGKNKTKEQFLGQMGGFSKLMPDLNWAVQEMIQEGDKVVVRSRATATPQGPLFGVDGEGRGFDILTIDIHTVADGKIQETYHVEDWAGALQQLKGM
ncbi:MAG: ester cyclase [Pseudomonadota bacterium]